MLTLLLYSLVFGAGWCLRGMLCARRGGCDALANERMAALERQIEALERRAWAMKQGLVR